MGDTAGIDNNNIRRRGCFSHSEPEPFEVLADLLSFILIDFAAKRIDGKSSHHVIYCKRV